MALLNDWLNEKYKNIADKLPGLVDENPASFSCGYNTGYKQSLLDLERFIDDLGYCEKGFENFYHPNWDIEECSEHKSDGQRWKRFEIAEAPWFFCKKCNQFYR